MIREILLRLWLAPWPNALRRRIEGLTTSRLLQLFLVPHFMVGLVGIIRNDHGEFLLFRHTYRIETPWGLPTGFMEHGEEPHEALRREICEEAGFTVEIGSVWTLYTDKKRRLLNVAYHGSHIGGCFRPSLEISEAKFFNIENLPPMLPDQRTLIENYVRDEVRH